VLQSEPGEYAERCYDWELNTHHKHMTLFYPGRVSLNLLKFIYTLYQIFQHMFQTLPSRVWNATNNLKKQCWVFISHIVSVLLIMWHFLPTLLFVWLISIRFFMNFLKNISSTSQCFRTFGRYLNLIFPPDKQGWYIDCYRVEGRSNSTCFISGKSILRVIKRNIGKEQYEQIAE